MGALPSNIIKSIPEHQRKSITQQADAIFSDFASSVAYVHIEKHTHYSFHTEALRRYFPQIISNLNNLFNRGDISVSYIGSGAYKHCFMLSFGDNLENRYVLQTFQNVMNFDPDYCPHGVLYEPQNAFAVYKKYSHGRIAKPFMSHPSTKEILSNGYILTKYIDSNHSAKTKLGPILTRRTKITNTDIFSTDNTIRGISVDIGGFTENPEHITAPQIRYHWHEIAQILDKIDFSPKATDIHIRLCAEYEKYGDNFFNTTLWPKITRHFDTKDKKAAEKTLKSLRRLKIKREKLSQNDDWEIVQKYLVEDLKSLPFNTLSRIALNEIQR